MQDDNQLTPGSGSEVGTTPAEGDSTEAVQAPATGEQTTTPTTSQAEESFFDPANVPEELKPAYKQMQSAFTKKTQEIAAARKEAESLKTKAEQFAKYEQYIPIFDEMLSNGQRQSAPAQTPEMAVLEQQLRKEGYSDEAIKLMQMGAGFVLNQFNQKETARDQMNQLSQKVSEAEALDDRLTDSSLVYTASDGTTHTFGDVVANLVKADPAWQQDPVAATRKAIATVDALVTKAKMDGKEELSASAKAKAAKFPSTHSSTQGAADSAQPQTMQEAAEAARKELGL